MSRCNNCKIQITDETDKCPFCQCVLVKDEGRVEDKYPQAWVTVRKFHLLENIVLFLSILATRLVMVRFISLIVVVIRASRPLLSFPST